jgi:hypothetical protein
MVSEVPYDPLMRWETDGGAVLPAPDGVADEVPAEGEAAGGETELEPRGEPNDGGPSHDAPGRGSPAGDRRQPGMRTS